MTDNTLPPTQSKQQKAPMTLQRWGGWASFLLPGLFIISELIYLMGNLREALGPFAYSVADFLYGPVKAVLLVTVVAALGERLGGHAPRRRLLSLLTAVLAGGMFVAAALLRASNRHYHIIHPELHLENNSAVLTVWTTLLAGVIATAWHFLGWSLVLLGSAGWSSKRLPRGLSVLYCVAGVAALFVYLLAELEGFAVLLWLGMSLWQGIVLWKAEPPEEAVG